MRWILGAVLVFGVGVVGVPRACADVTLVFVEQSHREPPKGAKLAATTEDAGVTVTLGTGTVATEEKGLREIFDFPHRRYYRVNLADRSYEERSLYSVLGLRIAELQHKLALDAALGADKADQTALVEPALLEHLYSLSAPGQKTSVDRSHVDGTTIYRWKDKELMSLSDAGQALPDAFAGSWWHWMRYHLGGHPKIYADLANSPRVPDALQVIRTNFGVETLTLHLKSLNPDGAPAASLDGFKASVPDGEPYASLRRLAARDGNALETWSARAQRDRDEAYSEGRSLDAMLTHMAYTSGSGDRSPLWLTQARDRLGTDPLASAFVAALSVSSREQLENAVKTLQGLRDRTHSPYVYVIDDFLGNDAVALGQLELAEKLYLGALSKNVLLAGAWFDLAKLYYLESRAPEAWACWDAARELRPGHPLQLDIDSYEHSLLTEHPEFF
jgi:tetratricopeptide (TPR) repeat protein